ncbi:hypothetical protein PRZ48_011370 [Zasmidium cellare]|uniref:Transcription factor Rba50 n=1 Tax=Zasmidium cellare TaxID=395010 RepID=A0ABR0E673_ZASCE|nr:hypothetical protein PRZ48_011370 [Zasmidium cellare]
MIRGERFELNLDSDDEEQQQSAPPLSGAFVGDVLERKPAAPKPPTAPVVKNKSGFPEHKKRSAESRFKQQKAKAQDQQVQDVRVENDAPAVSEDARASGKAKTWEEEEKERIDQENRQKIAQMSADEIEEERRELMSSFGPGLLQKLLQRSNVASGSEETDLSKPMGTISTVEESKPKPKPEKTVTFEEPVKDDIKQEEPTKDDLQEEAPTSNDPTPQTNILAHDTIHFPRPPQPPPLDPSSSTFLADLHEKYFPSLPSDPDKLEWMQSSTKDSAYDPSATAFNATDIRFNFRGELIPPKTASEIPVTEGLHHHGDAPDAAGYTIAELAHLARSTYPAQRCIAFQTLGRVLYRLSKGEFGNAGEDDTPETLDSTDNLRELARGLWYEVDRLKVIQILVDESEGKGVDGGRHQSAKAYATEAVWLWRRGGGRRWKAA